MRGQLGELGDDENCLATSTSQDAIPEGEALPRQDMDGMLQLTKKGPPIKGNNLYPILPERVSAEDSSSGDGKREKRLAPSRSQEAISEGNPIPRQDIDGLLRLPKKGPPIKGKSLYSILSEEVLVEEDSIFGPPPLKNRLSSLCEQPRLVRRLSSSLGVLNIVGDAPRDALSASGEKSRLEPCSSPCAVRSITGTSEREQDGE